MTEAELLSVIVADAELHGILVFHSIDSRRDIGKGFPDLVLLGRRSLIFAELKNSSNMSPEQSLWKYRLIATGAYYALWRPRDWENGHIQSVLDQL